MLTGYQNSGSTTCVLPLLRECATVVAPLNAAADALMSWWAELGMDYSAAPVSKSDARRCCLRSLKIDSTGFASRQLYHHSPVSESRSNVCPASPKVCVPLLWKRDVHELDALTRAVPTTVVVGWTAVIGG